MIKNTAGTKTNKMLATKPRSFTCIARKPLSDWGVTLSGYHQCVTYNKGLGVRGTRVFVGQGGQGDKEDKGEITIQNLKSKI
jgi:hypothetical protein